MKKIYIFEIANYLLALVFFFFLTGRIVKNKKVVSSHFFESHHLLVDEESYHMRSQISLKIMHIWFIATDTLCFRLVKFLSAFIKPVGSYNKFTLYQSREKKFKKNDRGEK